MACMGECGEDETLLQSLHQNMFVLTTISSHGRRLPTLSRRLVTLRPRAMQGPCKLARESRQLQERLGCQAGLLCLFSRRLGKVQNRDRRGPACAVLSNVWKVDTRKA